MTYPVFRFAVAHEILLGLHCIKENPIFLVLYNIHQCSKEQEISVFLYTLPHLVSCKTSELLL